MLGSRGYLCLFTPLVQSHGTIGTFESSDKNFGPSRTVLETLSTEVVDDI